MMRVSLRAGGIAVTAVREMDSLYVTQFGQQIKRAIDGDESEVRVFFLRAFVNLGRREVMVRQSDNVEDRLPGAGQFAAMLAQPIAHFVRDRNRHFSN